jgi:enoyl-[acyl-carrier protein] reductase / trans-2-enoyl-CoA reductase (NAD+)
MSELLAAVLGNGDLVEDERGRVHADQWELDSDLQDRASAIHDIISTENAATLLDLDSFRAELLRLSGFEVPGVPYEEPVEIHVPFPDVAPWRLSGA